MSAGKGIYILKTSAHLCKGTCGRSCMSHCKFPDSFVSMPGGRVKRCKNRRRDCYSRPEWKLDWRRPERRLKGLNIPEVREQLEDIPLQKADAAREEARARRQKEGHDRILAGYTHNSAPPVVVSKRQGLAIRRPVAGHVVQVSSGKLVYIVDAHALAA